MYLNVSSSKNAGSRSSRTESVGASLLERHPRGRRISGGSHVSTRVVDGRSIHRFDSVEVQASGPMTASIQATGNSSLGRGNQGPIPLLLEWDADQVSISPGTPFQWTFAARPLP
jgi:hypothetical protein